MIHAGKVPHDEKTHFYYAWDEVAYRSLCGRHTVDKRLVQESVTVTCRVCNEPEVDLMSDDTVKMSGQEPDLTTEEFMTLFNRAVHEGVELKYYLPAVKDLTPEDLVDHINKIHKFSLRIRVVKTSAIKTLNERKIHLSATKREELRIRDMQYKPKPAPKEGKAPRKRGTAKKEDAIETMMRILGVDRTTAEKRLARAQKKLEEGDVPEARAALAESEANE